ncbi:helix-turn-helix domain-containing protein [Brevibacterium luteolum]|uniref:helix-turn-helix domain-containing protein n=1 Tax=Brevibacterium luteolum TaxID=199591 RepID=UPI003B97BD56
MSRDFTRVDAMEHCGNRRPRVERLVSAWNQDIHGDAGPEDGADDPLIGASSEPTKRPRTQLTDEEVDAIRTARAQGLSVNALARQFGVHRGTVWAKTR